MPNFRYMGAASDLSAALSASYTALSYSGVNGGSFTCISEINKIVRYCTNAGHVLPVEVQNNLMHIANGSGNGDPQCINAARRALQHMSHFQILY
jgi:hypothetical protein